MFIYDFGDIVAWVFGGICILLLCLIKLLIWWEDRSKRKNKEKDEIRKS